MSDSLAAFLDRVEADDLNWAVFVEHEDGITECHDFTGLAYVDSDIAATRAKLEEFGHLYGPVACSEAVAAGLDALNVCRRCVPAA